MYDLGKKTIAGRLQDKNPDSAKGGHKERELDIKGADGGDYRVILRQSISNSLDFSIILAYRPPKSNQLFRLQRYNGKATNILTLLRVKHFMISIFIRLQNGIKRLEPVKILMPNQRIALLIFSRPLHVCSRIVALRFLLMLRAAFLRRYER